MKSTRDLLGTITALRQRLEQAKTLVDDAGSAAVEALKDQPHIDRLQRLGESVNLGRSQQQLLQTTLQQVLPAEKLTEGLPQHLSGGALRSLQRISELLRQLRDYSNEPLFNDDSSPAAVHYQDTVLLADLVFRTLKTMPEKPTQQMRLCSGLDVLIGVIDQRVSGSKQMIDKARKETAQLTSLARLLKRLASHTLRDINPFFTLAEEVVRDMAGGQTLWVTQSLNDDVVSHAAAHALNTARVIALVARHDSLWQSSLLQPVVAALVHDVGMLDIPAAVMQNPNEFGDNEQGVIERHCRKGADHLERVAPNETWLMEAAYCHHERLDGTGYPAGLVDEQITSLVRLLSVCDVYAACCASRPHRVAFDTRLALDEVVTMAQRGMLDPDFAGMLERPWSVSVRYGGGNGRRPQRNRYCGRDE